MKPLEISLLDLLAALESTDISLTLAGGYGLYLKQNYLIETDAQTLFSAIPVARSTQDLDLLLHLSVLVDKPKFITLRETLENLDYEPTDNKYWQWCRGIPIGERTFNVVVDILTGDFEGIEDQLDLNPKKDPRRVRPKGKPSPGLHARPTPEAIEFQDNLALVPVKGQLSDGEEREVVVSIASPLTYISMKLHAFRDRKDDNAKDKGRHHAMDLYRIIGLMTEEEYAQTKRSLTELQETETILSCKQIAQELFADEDSIGILRIKEHASFTSDLQLDEFVEILRELLQY